MDLTIKISDMAIIFATLLGPILAVQAQKWVERSKSADDRRRNVFRILMATRATTLSSAHVEALNQVPIEFHGRDGSSLREITDSWHSYMLELNVQGPTTALTQQRRRDKLLDLLYLMSQYLRYGFSKSEIQTDAYYPTGHVQIENDQAVIRRGFAKIFNGEMALPMAVKEFPTNPDSIVEQDALRKLLLEWLEGKRSVKVG